MIQTTPTVRVVVLPQERKVIRLQDLQPALSPHPAPIHPPIVVPPKILKRQSSGIKRKPTVQYRTYDPMASAPHKIKAIKSTCRGKILAIIANGPSITEVALEKLVGIPQLEIMSINMPDQRIWPTTHWAFFDLSQLRRHEKLWDSYNGYIFNSTSIRKQKDKSMQFRNQSGQGWSRDLVEHIFIGRSSVYATMQIAQWMAYDHTYIFGVDMNPDGIGGKLHFYGVNPDVEPNIRAQRFEAESKYYDKAAEVLTENERMRYTFCSLGINPWPFLQKFKACEHTKAVDIILEHTAQLIN